MKYFLKTFLVNIFFCLFIFVFFDWFIIISQCYDVKVGETLGIFNANDRMETDLPYDTSKGSIVTMGCSFTYGSGIEDNETLAYKLQKLTMRKTYNRGYPATGIQHVLLQLQNSEFFNNKQIISPPPEYFIYVFISDHMRRLYLNYFDFSYFSFINTLKYIKYEKSINNQLTLNHWDKKEFSDYIKVSCLAKKFNDLMYKIKSNDELFDFFKLHLIESKKLIDDKYKNAKFIVIVYSPELDTHGFRSFRTERWNELETEGFKVIRFDGKEYEYLKDEEFISDGFHPSGKAWDMLVPEIIKQSNL